MREQLYCPHCGLPLVNVCPHCGIPEKDQRSASWPRDVSTWSFKHIALFWIVGLAATYFVFSLDPQNIGVALVPYLMVLFGVPYALITLTRKWQSSRR
jgi:hypothetical protein